MSVLPYLWISIGTVQQSTGHHPVGALQGSERCERDAQDEEIRALQRETGISSQHATDLRERLNFQCFKYELLVDMVCMPRLHKLSLHAHHKCSN